MPPRRRAVEVSPWQFALPVEPGAESAPIPDAVPAPSPETTAVPKQSPIPTAETLPGMPERPFKPVRVNARNSLSYALTPGYVGINPNDYGDITPDILALGSAEHLRGDLFDLDRNSSNSTWYKGTSLEPGRRIAIPAVEAALVEGNIQTFGNRAVKNVQKARNVPGIRPSDADRAAAIRGGVHRVESVETNITRYLSNALEPRIELVRKFQEAVKYPNLARMGSEGVMRQNLTLLHTEVLGDMFDVLREQRDWSPTQEDRAKRAIEKRIYLDRGNNRHLENFAELMELLDTWQGYRRAVLLNKRQEARNYIRQNKVDS